jgi:hypothetical protein
LESPWYKNYILTEGNRIPLSNGGHTLEFYKKLPHGWRTTPQGIWTDWYMWQQILSADGVRAMSIQEPTVLHFSSADRNGFSSKERGCELKEWYELTRRPEELGKFTEYVKNDRMTWYKKELQRLDAEINTLQETSSRLADTNNQRFSE